MAHINASKTTAMILSGELDVSAWSEEELIRGQRRDRNGKWGGRPPKVIPKVIHDELVKRKMSAAYDLLNENVLKAVEVLVEVACDPDAEAGVRVKAASLILDRGMGKAPVNVNITTEAKWQAAITHSIVSMPAAELLSLESRIIEATEHDYIAHDPEDD